MGIVVLARNTNFRFSVHSDTESIFSINAPLLLDIETSNALIVSSDIETSNSLIVSYDTQFLFCVAPVVNDIESSYTLRPFISNDIESILYLEPLKVKNDVLSTFNIFVSNDTQILFSVRETIKNDVEFEYLILNEVTSLTEFEYDITTINFVYKDFLSIYMIHEPDPDILNFGFWVKLEGEN